MDPNESGRLADANLAFTWSLIGRSGRAAIGGTEQCPFVASGIDAASFNGAFTTQRVVDPDAVVADAIEFMAEHSVPWLMWVREGVDDALLAAGRRAGLRDAGGPPGMVLDSIERLPARPGDLKVEIVSDASGLDIFHDVVARGFDMPLEILQGFVTIGMMADPSVVAVIGSVAGIAVSAAFACVSGATIGIYNVATPVEHRRRGYGEAITWAVIEAGAALGGEHAALQASELGAPVYRSMGFVDIGRYLQLEGPPHPPQ